ncbi:MAG TPA: PAS domain S-box protein [Bryobacteraceae bacterium]|jgi:PAS domain S-box-containing protein|nr:PAS domain S-box protein [Bryobacteraceae bacterium]
METPTQSTSVCPPEDLIDFFDFAPEMLAVLSIDGEFLRVNAASEPTIGRVRESLIGTSFLDLVYPDDLHAAAQKFMRTSQADVKVSFRSRCPGGDGRLRWIQWDLRRSPNRLQIYAIARDVTDHCVADKELARANEILSMVLLTAPLPIWASDPEGRIQFWNESAEKVLGWASDEIFNGKPPDVLPTCGGTDAKSRLAGEKMPWRRKDGSTRQLRFWTAPLHENGAQCGTLGMTVDVTEYDAEVYEALQRAYNDLRDTRDAVLQHERLRVLGQMASGIAHDINNALSPVKLYIQLLMEDEQSLTDQGRANLKTIKNAVEDVAETIARIREFYRLREPQLTLAPVNLNELVHQVIDLTRPRWRDIPQQTGVMIETATLLAESLPPVLGIESEIREALTNLIFNAVDAMPSGGILTLRTGVVNDTELDGFSEDGYAYVEVVDTGLGMDEDTCRRCLEPFFTTKGERGTGLGLATVYGVMQRNSGTVDIQSILGEGTAIRLRFGVARSGDAPSDRAVLPPASASPIRILVIDDDPLVAQALRYTLERDGHHVTTANGGEAGVDTFRAARNQGVGFDLVLTDLGMPYVDGRRVASAVKAESPSTPVVLLTGWGRRIVAERDVPPHVDRVLSKPPDLDALRDVVASCSAIGR